MLLFSPEKSEIRSSFGHLIPPWIIQAPEVEKDWSPALTALVGHSRQAFTLAFSPSDNNILVTSSDDNTTKVWDCITGAELHTFEEPSLASCAAFSVDGKKIAYGVLNVVRIREFTKGGVIDLEVDTWKNVQEVTQVSFSPKTSNIVAAIPRIGTMLPPYPEGPGSLQIWDIDQREIRFSVTEWDVTAVAFSPSGDFVAVGDNEGRIGLWGLENGDRRLIFKPHGAKVYLIQVVLDGGLVVSGAHDGDGKVWNVAEDLAEREFQFWTFAFSPPQGEFIVIGTPSNVFELRRTSSWALIGTFGKASPRGPVTLSRDGDLLTQAAFEDSRVWLWGKASETAVTREQYREDVLPTEDSHGRPITYVGFLPGTDEEVVVVKDPAPNDSDRRLQIWRHDGQTKDLNLPHRIRKVHISPNKRFVGLEAYNSSVQLWDGKMERRVAKYDADGIVFSPDGGCIALLSERNITIMTVVNDTTLEKKAIIEEESSERRSVTFSADGCLIGWLQAGKLHVWDLETMEMISQPISPSTPELGSIAFSLDGRVWAAVIQTGTMIVSRTLLPDAMTRQKRNMLHSDTQELTTTGLPQEVFSQPIRRWDVEEMAISSTTGRVVVLFSSRPDRSTYVSIKTWDLATGAEVSRYSTNTQIVGLTFSQDLRYLDCPQGQLPLPNQGVEPDVTTEVAQGCLCIGNEWIICGLDNLIWLPPAYQRRRGSVKGQTIALEVFDRVIIIKVDLSKIASLR